MGYFRRLKISDYTAAQCKQKMRETVQCIRQGSFTLDEIEVLMEKWACFRELLARHEGKNASPLDKNTPD